LADCRPLLRLLRRRRLGSYVNAAAALGASRVGAEAANLGAAGATGSGFCSGLGVSQSSSPGDVAGLDGMEDRLAVDRR
jgi:hypothetical protein